MNGRYLWKAASHSDLARVGFIIVRFSVMVDLSLLWRACLYFCRKQERTLKILPLSCAFLGNVSGILIAAFEWRHPAFPLLVFNQVSYSTMR